MRRRQNRVLPTKTLLAKVGEGRSVMPYRKKEVIFSQGDPGDAVFYIQNGKVKLTVFSAQGKEAVIALLGEGDFFGEACLTAQERRMETASAIEESAIVRLPKESMLRMLQTERKLSEQFMHHLLTRNIRIQEDLVDQLFNSSERRLARILMLLAHVGKAETAEKLVPRVSQETLAEMVGTTRSRVSHFMNKFRKLGFIDYNGGLEVHSSLLNVVLHD